MINLNEYFSKSIKNLTGNAISVSQISLRQKFFLYRFHLNSKKAAKLRNNYAKEGTHVPPFLIASITSSCNLKCKGCYARANKMCGEDVSVKHLSSDKYNQIFSEAEKLGICFILLAGGEPLLRDDVITVAAGHKKILFPVFTNGILLNDTYIKLFNKNRNLVPVISIEGGEKETDGRRGEGVYNRTLTAMQSLKTKKIFYGVSITVTKYNIEEVTDTSFINSLIKNGCKTVFYVEYVGEDGELDDAEREIFNKKLAALRNSEYKILFIAFPGDEKLTEGCLAAGRGFFHISPGGSAEPCPFSPYSDMNITDKSIIDCLKSPFFNKLTSSEIFNQTHTGGCLLNKLENEVKEMLDK